MIMVFFLKYLYLRGFKEESQLVILFKWFECNKMYNLTVIKVILIIEVFMYRES